MILPRPRKPLILHEGVTGHFTARLAENGQTAQLGKLLLYH